MGANSLSLLTYVAAWAATIGGLWLLFEKGESSLTPDAKATFAAWLRSKSFSSFISSWPLMFIRLFERIFGSHHFTMHCFTRSCIASIVSVSIVTLIWATITSPTTFLTLFSSDSAQKIFSQIFILFGCLGAFNLIPDYFSLFQSRFILKIMSNVDSVVHIFLYLILDLVLSTLIFLLCTVVLFMYGFYKVMMVVKGGWDIASYLGAWIDFFVRVMLPLETDKQLVIPYGIFYYSTLFTSVWVWLYVLSGMFLKFLKWFVLPIERISGFLDIDKKPIRCIGFVAILIVTLLYLIIPFILYLSHKCT